MVKLNTKQIVCWEKQNKWCAEKHKTNDLMRVAYCIRGLRSLHAVYANLQTKKSGCDTFKCVKLRQFDSFQIAKTRVTIWYTTKCRIIDEMSLIYVSSIWWVDLDNID